MDIRIEKQYMREIEFRDDVEYSINTPYWLLYIDSEMCGHTFLDNPMCEFSFIIHSKFER